MQSIIGILWMEYVPLWILFNTFANIALQRIWVHMHEKARKTMARRRYSATAAVVTVVVLVSATMASLGVIAVEHHGHVAVLVEYLTTEHLFLGVFLLYILLEAMIGWWYTGARLPDNKPESPP